MARFGKFTVFELYEEDEAIARGLSLDRAFGLVCKRAGFTPNFWQTDSVTTLDLTDCTDLGRTLPPRKNHHEEPDQAMRTLMRNALDIGVWGYFGMTDFEWDDHAERCKLLRARERLWDPKEPMTDGQRLREMRKGGENVAPFSHAVAEEGRRTDAA